MKRRAPKKLAPKPPRKRRVRVKNPRRRVRARKRNPLPTQHVLYAQRKGGPVLKYVGGIKFSQAGHAMRFASKEQALRQGLSLKRQFKALRPYRIWGT